MFSLISIVLVSITTLGIYIAINQASKKKVRLLLDKTPKRTMSKLTKEVVNKLRHADNEEFENKLWDDVCPMCGASMEVNTYGFVHQYSDHWCTKCDFITKLEVL